MKILINKYILLILMSLFFIESILANFDTNTDHLSPKSLFPEKLKGQPEVIAIMDQAVALLEGTQSLADFQMHLRNLGLESSYQIEGLAFSIDAVRFTVSEGKSFRLGRQALASSHPALGFLMSTKTKPIKEFWLESFEKTIDVEILVPGVALGTIVKIEGTDFKNYIDQESIDVQVANEIEKLEQIKEALLKIYEELIAASNEEQQGIYEMEKMMVEYDFIPKIAESISPSITAREATMRFVRDTLSKFQKKYDASASDADRYINNTSLLTIKNIGQQLIDSFDGVDRIKDLDQKIEVFFKKGQRVILSGEILPMHFKLSNRKAVAGIITDNDQPGSHNVVLAKGARIPYAKNGGRISSFNQELQEGNVIALELIPSDKSGRASITLEPSTNDRNRILRKIEGLKKYREAVSRMRARTRDNRYMPLHLNMALHEDFSWGVGDFHHFGLVRSDFTYLQTPHEPSLEELRAEYQSFFKNAADKKVSEINFRTFDLDLGDKSPSFFKNPDQREGIDFSLNDEQGAPAFKTQVRAIFMGLKDHLDNKGNPIQLNLLFPKVRNIEEYRQASQIVATIYDQLTEEDPSYTRIQYRLGIMVETKEALDHIEDFVKEVQFINVGTNDLTLSLFPNEVSRKPMNGKASISTYNHRVLSALVKIVNAASAIQNIHMRPPICVCGELASYSEYGLFLLGLGYRGLTLSMPYDQVLEMKVKIASLDYDEIQRYSSEVLSKVNKAEHAPQEEQDDAYQALKTFLNDKRAEMEQSALDNLLYDWGLLNLSFEQLIQILRKILISFEKLGKIEDFEDWDAVRNHLATLLMEQNIITPQICEKAIERSWDIESLLTALEVWAYQKLVDQGTFYVYRAQKIGNDYWLRVLSKGNEYQWKSRYERRIIKDEVTGNIFIKAGPDKMFPAKLVDSEDGADIYTYQEEDGIVRFARNIDVTGIPFTHIKAGPEKKHIINVFKSGKPGYPQHEHLYKDADGIVQIIHSPDWTLHPILQAMPYARNSQTASTLLFLMSDNNATGDITFGQNMAGADYGQKLEDNVRALEMLIEKMTLVDSTIRACRRQLEQMKTILGTKNIKQERDALIARVRELELQLFGTSKQSIFGSVLLDQAA